MNSLYPRGVNSLVRYLTANPVLDVKFSTKITTYVFQGFDGVRAEFKSPDGSIITLPLTGIAAGSIQYHEDGFDRHVGNMVGHYYYRGPRPWKKMVLTEREKQIANWDEIFSNLRI